MRIGEAISRDVVERWEERGLIRGIPLPNGARRVRAGDLANLRPGEFTGLAPLREDDTATRGQTRAIDQVVRLAPAHEGTATEPMATRWQHPGR